jgi:adenine-specific DNA-methyltransferase
MKASDTVKGASAYKHLQDSVQRPDVGVEAQFPNKKPSKGYRYDSALRPNFPGMKARIVRSRNGC